MKKYAWLAALVCAVFILGAVGNNGVQDVQDIPEAVTHGALLPASDDGGYVSVTMHEPTTHVALPAEKLVGLQDDRKNRLFSSDGAADDLSLMTMPEGRVDDGPAGRDQKKKMKGFLAPRESPGGDDLSGSLLEKDNGGWGNGWLGEAIFSEQKSGPSEADQHEASADPDASSRGRLSLDFDRSGSASQDSYKSGRSSSSGSLFDTGSGSKSSFKLEPWTIQKR